MVVNNTLFDVLGKTRLLRKLLFIKKNIIKDIN